LIVSPALTESSGIIRELAHVASAS
jgi:hypothetical protein